MKILIIYGTTEGQTHTIARFIEDELTGQGYAVTLALAGENAPGPEAYDAVLIGASIHIGKYQSGVKQYISNHLAGLNQLPSAFFSVSLAIASDNEEEHREVEKLTAKFLEEIGWEPMLVRQVAGALKYTQYDFFTKMLMKQISRKEGRTTDTSMDHEFTNWDDVKAFVKEFAEKTASVPVM